MAHQHYFSLVPRRRGGGFVARCDCGVMLAKEGAMTKKVTTITAPREASFESPADSKPKPNATIGDAVNYVSSNPSGLGLVIEAGRWLVGLIAALFRPAVKKP